MFERTYTVERFQCDRNDTLSVPTLFLCLNDIMERNAESYGMGADFHIKQHLAWVLVEYQVHIHAWPKSDEDFVVGTLPYSFKRMYGYRIYSGRYKSGKRLMEGKGKFALIDIHSKQFVRPTQEMLDKFTDAYKEPKALKFDKWGSETGTLLSRMNRSVFQDGIDVNGHLNNAYFPMYAYQALSKTLADSLAIEFINVKYRKEVFEGETLTFNVLDVERGIRVDMYKDQGVLAAQVLFTSQNKND